MKKILITSVLLLITNLIVAQNYKFGKVSKEELEEQFYPQDSSANAVVLYKNRRTHFRYIQGEGFMVETVIHERIKIYNSEGYGWATKYVSYYDPDASDKEKVSILSAKTFSLSNGKIQSSKLNKSETFDEKVSKNWSRIKFTMPNLTDGCVVEWEYRLTSPYRSIDKVELQYQIPIKKIQCEIEIPQYYFYNVKHTGYVQINSTSTEKSSTLSLTNKNIVYQANGAKDHQASSTSYEKVEYITNVTSIDNEYVPALLEESHINNINNYKTEIYYELASVKWPEEPIKHYVKSWDDVTRTILKKYEFGDELGKNGYFKDDLEAIIVKSGGEQTQVLFNIFEFVKQKVKWNGIYEKYSYDGVRKAYKEGSGSSADINFILVAMLREVNFNANPVLISTRNHGAPVFPTIDGFNFVIAAVEMDNSLLLLDGTEEYSTHTILPFRDLNGQGRLVREDGTSEWVNLMPTQLSEQNITMNIIIDATGSIDGMKRAQYTNQKALNYRNKYSKIKEEDIIVKMEAELGGIEISDFKITNKNEIYKPIVETYKFYSEDLLDIVGDKIYFKPSFFEAISKNPFRLEKRVYPIDFGTPIATKNVISITIPDEYTIESIPESFAISLPNNYGVYKFNISVWENKISVYSSFKMNTAIYPIEYYPEIKEFYKLLINKNLEQVVLRKES